MPGILGSTELDDISGVLDHVTTDKDRVILIREGNEVAALVPLKTWNCSRASRSARIGRDRGISPRSPGKGHHPAAGSQGPSRPLEE